MIHSYESEKIAEKYWRKLIAVPVLTAEVLHNWLLRLRHEFDFGLMDFEITIDYKQSVFTSGPLRYDLKDFMFTHNICAILQQYQKMLPNPYNLLKK